MCEFLVLAKNSWMDDLDEADLTERLKNEKFKRMYDRRNVKGDIICVREDGQKWGKKECRPDFIIVKIPGVPASDLKYLASNSFATIDTETRLLLRKQRYQLPKSYVEGIVSVVDSVTLNRTTMLNYVTDKEIKVG